MTPPVIDIRVLDFYFQDSHYELCGSHKQYTLHIFFMFKVTTI